MALQEERPQHERYVGGREPTQGRGRQADKWSQSFTLWVTPVTEFGHRRQLRDRTVAVIAAHRGSCRCGLEHQRKNAREAEKGAHANIDRGQYGGMTRDVEG